MTGPGTLDLLRLGLARGSRWRVLALFAGLAALPSAVAVLPLWSYLSQKLDGAVGTDALAQGLPFQVVVELMRGLDEGGGGRAIGLGIAGGLVAALLVGPWSAGAALAEARAEEPMRMRPLLGVAGELYGRLLRMLLVAAIPLGIAAAIAGGLMKGADDAGKAALTEGAALGYQRWARAGAALLLFLAHLTVDAGRAHLAARPDRRSAFLAWVAGAWMVLRKPARAIMLGAAGTGLAFGLGFVAMALRERLPPGPAWSTALGFLLATGATFAVAWGRSVRLAALSELAAVDGLERARSRALKAARQATRIAKTEPMLEAIRDPPPVLPAEAPPIAPEQPDATPPPPPRAARGDGPGDGGTA